MYLRSRRRRPQLSTNLPSVRCVSSSSSLLPPCDFFPRSVYTVRADRFPCKCSIGVACARRISDIHYKIRRASCAAGPGRERVCSPIVVVVYRRACDGIGDILGRTFEYGVRSNGAVAEASSVYRATWAGRGRVVTVRVCVRCACCGTDGGRPKDDRRAHDT